MVQGTCSVASCVKPVQARGWCGTHYRRWSRTKSVNADVKVRVMTSRDGMCNAKDCDRPISCSGWCAKHWSRVRRGQDPNSPLLTREERFWSHIDRSDGCWEWPRTRNAGGYGIFVHEWGALAHRYSWIVTNGPIPEGLDVLHHCDNPPCVRPDHLFLGTDADNVADKYAKGRQGVYSGYGRKLTWANVEEIRSAGGTPLKVLAERYGVGVSSVWNIRHYRSWDPAKRNPNKNS